MFDRRRLGFCAGFCLILASLLTEASAQTRIYARVEPNPEGTTDKLVFDTNLDSTDNISPNILFNADASLGYVAYTGSGTVAVFDMNNGKIVSRIKTDGKPFYGVLLPGGRTIAYVSVMDNRIFLMDVANLTLTGTWSFANAQFGYASVPVLSPDGKYGYVSSTGTGEVIKFRLNDGGEEGRFKGFQGPARLALSKDGTTLIIVDTLTEDVIFGDTGSLSRKTTLAVPKNQGINFTMFNYPVLSPDGTTGIIASQDINGTFGSDTVFLFKTATGEMLASTTIGSQPAYTALTPDGACWAVLSELAIHLIPVTDFNNPRRLDLTNGQSIGSATIAFSPDSRFAYYPSSPKDLLYQHDLTTGAIVGQMTVGDNPNNMLDQPSTVAITPDGRRLAVLEMVSNNIELVTSATTLNAAKFISSADTFTGVTLINLAQAGNKFRVYALDNYGTPITGTNVTNPAVFEVPSNGQVTQTVQQMFNFDSTTETNGWLSVYSDLPEVTGYLSIGDNSLNRLDAAPMFKATEVEWIVPEVARHEGTIVEMNFTNPNFNQTTFDVTRYAATGGDPIGTSNGQVSYPTNRQVQYFADQFPNPAEVDDGYLRIKSGFGIVFSEFINTPTTFSQVNGIDLSRYTGIQTLYSPQFAITPNFDTVLNVINASSQACDIAVTLYANDGSRIGEPHYETLAKGAQVKRDLATLFGYDRQVENLTGWLKVESTQAPVVGTVSFTNQAQDFKTTFELLGTPQANFLFPVVAQDDVYWTGIALLNPGAEPAHLTLELWGTGGGTTPDRSTNATLAPGNRSAIYLLGYFPDLEPRLSGYIRVHSDKPLYGFSLIHNAAFSFMTAIPALPMP